MITKLNMELTLIEFIHLLSLLPNPLTSFSKGVEICSVVFPITQKNVERLRIMEDFNDPLSREKVFYNNSVDVQFKLNAHEKQTPFWEPVDVITIKKYNSLRAEKMKDEGTYKFPYRPL